MSDEANLLAEPLISPMTLILAIYGEDGPEKLLGSLSWFSRLDMPSATAETAIATCKANGYSVSAHVIGRNGEVIVAMRGDGTGPHTLENSFKKAYTAKAFRRSSGDYGDSLKDNFTAGGLHLSNIVTARGALPVTVDGDVIGAIGVSGAPGGEKDEVCAKAGIDKVANDLK